MEISITTTTQVEPILFNKSLSEEEAEFVGNLFISHNKIIINTFVTEKNTLILIKTSSAGRLDHLIDVLNDIYHLESIHATEKQARSVMREDILIGYYFVDDKFKSVM